jgi:hypothetical protein
LQRAGLLELLDRELAPLTLSLRLSELWVHVCRQVGKKLGPVVTAKVRGNTKRVGHLVECAKLGNLIGIQVVKALALLVVWM